MAVLEGLEGIEITVRVDDQALVEYDDDDVEKQPGSKGEYQASKTVAKYVEAVTSKEFAISLNVKTPYKMDCPTLAFYVTVDGSAISRPLLLKSNYRNKKWGYVVDGVSHTLESASKRCSVRHFRFAEIQTSKFDALVENVLLKISHS